MLLLLLAHVEKFSVTHMQDFLFFCLHLLKGVAPYVTDSLLANSAPLQNQPLGQPHVIHRHNFCTNGAIFFFYNWGNDLSKYLLSRSNKIIYDNSSCWKCLATPILLIRLIFFSKKKVESTNKHYK